LKRILKQTVQTTSEVCFLYSTVGLICPLTYISFLSIP